jgi:hypothetical protein
MNCVYFACPHCLKCIDAGYRWAASTLEAKEIVQQTKPVSIERVLAANEYWDVETEPGADWLRDKVLPKVRLFLAEHRSHLILYVDEDWLSNREDDFSEQWLEVETWCPPRQAWVFQNA